MEPLSIAIVGATALLAFAAKSIIQRLFTILPRKDSTLKIITAAGTKISIQKSELTGEKVAEIVRDFASRAS